MNMNIKPLNPNPFFDEMVDISKLDDIARHKYWLNHDLFTYQWWLLIAIAILFWLLLYFLMDRKRIQELTLLGSFLVILTLILDSFGSELVWWSYPHSLFWMFSWLYPVDFVGLPVSFILIYQYFPSWKKYLIAITILAFVFTFILEPILTLMDMYRLYEWKYFYSFPIYIAMGAGTKWIVNKLFNKDTSQ